MDEADKIVIHVIIVSIALNIMFVYIQEHVNV